MGCHTWLYNKVEPQPTYDEVKDWVIKNVISANRDIFKSDEYVIYYPEMTREESDFYVSVCERQIRMINKGLCKEGVCNKYEHNGELTKYYNGDFYDQCDYFPFIFRVFDYQEDILTSYDETEKFILSMFEKSTNDKPTLEPKNDNTIYTYSAEMNGKIKFASEDYLDTNLTDPTLSLKRSKEFFEKYPNGLITFA